MAIRHRFVPRGAGLLRLRDPGCCVLIAGHPIRAILKTIIGNRAELESSAPIPIGTTVMLHHGEAGIVQARIVAQRGNQLSLGFQTGRQSAGFALSALKRAVAV